MKRHYKTLTALLIFFFLIATFFLIPKIIQSITNITENKTEDKSEETLKESVNISENTKKEEISYVHFKDTVEHLFFHPLIVNTKEAFKGDYRTNNFDDWFITLNEFNKIMDSLYKNNYILVDINSLYEEYTNELGQNLMRRKELKIPEGKKPLIISIDDLSYNKGMMGGTSDKLILDENGELATYRKNENNKDIVSYDETVILMDKFVKKHPDFSLNGAKGTIALTGYEGILGYKTDFDSKNYELERELAKRVVRKLKENGWTFASHSYGHNDHSKRNLDKIKKDADKWEKEVTSLIGTTQIYIYPHGTQLSSTDEKFKYLQSKGFKIFYGVGKECNETFGTKSPIVMADRLAVDGISFRHKRSLFLKFFDSKEVMDLDTRPSRPYDFNK